MSSKGCVEKFDLLEAIRGGTAPFALLEALEKVESGTFRPAHPTPHTNFDELENLQLFMSLLKEVRTPAPPSLCTPSCAVFVQSASCSS